MIRWELDEDEALALEEGLKLLRERVTSQQPSGDFWCDGKPALSSTQLSDLIGRVNSAEDIYLIEP